MNKLKDYDDVRDLSIELTDDILNHFENYIPKNQRNSERFDVKEIPILIDTKEQPHIKIWFDDEKGNRGSFYSWELQDLITEIVSKRFKIKEE
jgi:hypothetical protein